MVAPTLTISASSVKRASFFAELPQPVRRDRAVAPLAKIAAAPPQRELLQGDARLQQDRAQGGACPELAPELFGREPGALGNRLELGPDDLRVNLRVGGGL